MLLIQLQEYSASIYGIDLENCLQSQMITARHNSQHKTNHHLYRSLSKQYELTNRLSVLLLEKQKKLKNIERRIIQAHTLQENRLQKLHRKQELEQSFETNKRSQIYKNQLFTSLKRQLSDSIIKKQFQLRQTKQQWYKMMKKMEKENTKKIQLDKLSQLQRKTKSKNQVQLTKLCIKQNIRKYWDERLGYIQECKMKDNLQKTKLFEATQQNISILQEKEQQLLEEIRRESKYANRLKLQDYSILNQEKTQLTSRNTQSLF